MVSHTSGGREQERPTRAGAPLIPLPRRSEADSPRSASPVRPASAVPASASTGVADLLRGPVRPARVLMSVPAAVYLQVPTDRGSDIVGVLTSDAARLPLGCILFRPSNGRPLAQRLYEDYAAYREAPEANGAAQ